MTVIYIHLVLFKFQYFMDCKNIYGNLIGKDILNTYLLGNTRGNFIN